MGGPSGSVPAPETTAQTLQDYAKYIPGAISATAQASPQIAESQLASTQATQPGYNALNLQQAQDYAVPLAQVGQNVQNSNTLAGSSTVGQQIAGPGGAAAGAALGVNQATNPDYYQAADAAAKGAAEGVNAINLTGLSPGEYNATERSLNNSLAGTGNLGLNNATNAVSNAMNFGGAFNNKLGLLNSATGAATGATNATAGNGGFNGVNVALAQPTTSTSTNFGTNTFSPTSSSTNAASTGTGFNFGSGLLGDQTSSNNAAIGANASEANANSIPTYLNSTLGNL